MLQESLDFAFHFFLAPKYIAKLGFLQEIIGIKYRSKRQNWLEHQNNSKKEILKTSSKLTQKRKALIIGAGLLLDVPLKELAEEFEEVILVDIFFLQEIIDEIKTYKNCHFEMIDISASLKEAYYLWENNHKDKKEFDKKLRNLIHKKPSYFLLENDIDLVVSCNLLSQLHMAFENFAEKKKILETETLKSYLASFAANHIEYLNAFPKHTNVLLLTDTEKILFDRDDNRIESMPSFDLDLIQGFKQSNSWDWLLADFGELNKDYALKLEVNAYTRE